jgi:membrane-bound lytic murein transglycosylase E
LHVGGIAFGWVCERANTASTVKLNVNNNARGSFLDARTPPEGEFGTYIRTASNSYGIDETLIKAIIQVESGGNPHAVSTSNAIGLMQLKASTAGKDAYRKKGRGGQPTSRELKDSCCQY